MSTTRTNDEPLREGDIYRWSWRPDSRESRAFEPYHCRAQIAVVRGGRLLDTYWAPGGDGDDLAGRVDWVRVANLDDLKASDPSAHECYEPRDVVDLRHKNGGVVYVRKGAEPSVRVQIESWTRKRDEARARAESCQRQIDWLVAQSGRPSTAEACT